MKISLKERIEVLNKIYEYSRRKLNLKKSAEYLKNRKINIDNDFGFIGYNINIDDSFLSRIAPKYLLMELGFINIDKKTGKMFQNLYGICIPHFDENNDVVFMTFRNHNGGNWRYKNIKNCDISLPYNSNNINYNMPLYVVEGAIDCLSMIQMGYKNCVGMATKNIRKNMIQYFEKFKKIYFCIDGGESDDSLKRIHKSMSNINTNCNLRQFHDKDANDSLFQNRDRYKILSGIKHFEHEKKDYDEGLDKDTKRWYNNNVDINDLISVLGGERNGIKYKCIFPDHFEHEGSLATYPNNSFYCYGCDRGGFAYNMVYEYLRLINGIEPKREEIFNFFDEKFNCKMENQK